MAEHPYAEQLRTMKQFFDRSTSALTEADSVYAPTKEQFTVAATVAHVAQTVDWFLEGTWGKGFNMDFAAMDGECRPAKSLTEARKRLDGAFDAAIRRVEGMKAADFERPMPPNEIFGPLPAKIVFGALNDHTAHHRGALTVYARLLGRMPPMPYGEPPG